MAAVEPYKHTYAAEEDILDAYMTFADVDLYEASEFYARRDAAGLYSLLARVLQGVIISNTVPKY